MGKAPTDMHSLKQHLDSVGPRYKQGIPGLRSHRQKQQQRPLESPAVSGPAMPAPWPAEGAPLHSSLSNRSRTRFLNDAQLLGGDAEGGADFTSDMHMHGGAASLILPPLAHPAHMLSAGARSVLSTAQGHSSLGAPWPSLAPPSYGPPDLGQGPRLSFSPPADRSSRAASLSGSQAAQRGGWGASQPQKAGLQELIL